MIDDVAICVDVLNNVLERYGLPKIDISLYRKGFCFPVRQFYERLGFDFSRQSYQQIADEYIELYRQRQSLCQPHPGTVEVLQWCQDNGFCQHILSAYQQALLEEAVERLRLAGFFAKIVGNTDHLAGGKLQQGQEMFRQLDIDPSEVLLIGDTTHDYEVASSLKTDCILIGQGHQDPSRLRSCPVPVLASIRQVPRYLGRP